jgi:hypothetical protein
VTDALDQPQPPDALTLVDRDDAPPIPAAGRVVFWLDAQWGLRGLTPDGDEQFSVGADGAPQLVVLPNVAQLFGGGNGRVAAEGDNAALVSDLVSVSVTQAGTTLQTAGLPVVLNDLPTVDPEVVNALWIEPITRQLRVSAG